MAEEQLASTAESKDIRNQSKGKGIARQSNKKNSKQQNRVSIYQSSLTIRKFQQCYFQLETYSKILPRYITSVQWYLYRTIGEQWDFYENRLTSRYLGALKKVDMINKIFIIPR